MVYQPSFRDSISAFLRRKALFMLAFGVACLAGGTYLLVKQPLYLSSASLVLHFDSQAVPDIDRTMKPTQLQGSNEHREILYSDADILHSGGIIRERGRQDGSGTAISRRSPRDLGTPRTSSTSRNRLLQRTL